MQSKMTSRSEYGEHAGRSYEIRILDWDGAAFIVTVYLDGFEQPKSDDDHSWSTYEEAVRRGHELARSMIGH